MGKNQKRGRKVIQGKKDKRRRGKRIRPKSAKKEKSRKRIIPNKIFLKTFLLKEIESLKNIFPYKYEVTIGLLEFIAKYKDIIKND